MTSYDVTIDDRQTHVAVLEVDESLVSNFEQGTTTVGPQFMSHDDDIESSYLRGSNYLLRGPGSGFCEEGSDSLRGGS